VISTDQSESTEKSADNHNKLQHVNGKEVSR